MEDKKMSTEKGNYIERFKPSITKYQPRHISFKPLLWDVFLKISGG